MNRTDTSLIALRRILRAIEQYERDLAQAAGLTAVQLRVLQIVAEQGHTTPTHIAQRMSVSQAAVSVLIKKLEARGYLARRRSDADRRQTDLTITEAGRDKTASAPDALQQRYVGQFEALQDWEQAMVVAVLERVAGLLDASDMPDEAVLTAGELLAQGPN
jgi:DNA-binding MarR family transcriptional regulator